MVSLRSACTVWKKPVSKRRKRKGVVGEEGRKEKRERKMNKKGERRGRERKKKEKKRGERASMEHLYHEGSERWLEEKLRRQEYFAAQA